MRKQLLLTALITLVLSLSVAWADGAGKDKSFDGKTAVKTTPTTASAPDANRGVGNGKSTEARSGSAQPILVVADSSTAKKNATANAANILFDYEKTSLKDGGRVEAEKFIAKLKQNEKDSVVVEGHTCMEAEADYIITLAQRRAESVKKYMVERGIEPARIKVESCGEAKPMAPNDTPPNRKLNRRVEVQYIPCK